MLYPAELRGRRHTVYPQQAIGAKIQAPKNTPLEPMFSAGEQLIVQRRERRRQFNDYFGCRINALGQFPRLAYVNSENIDRRF